MGYAAGGEIPRFALCVVQLPFVALQERAVCDDSLPACAMLQRGAAFATPHDEPQHNSAFRQYGSSAQRAAELQWAWLTGRHVDEVDHKVRVAVIEDLPLRRLDVRSVDRLERSLPRSASCVACCMLPVGCRTSHVACCMLHVAFCPLDVARRESSTACHNSCRTEHAAWLGLRQLCPRAASPVAAAAACADLWARPGEMLASPGADVGQPIPAQADAGMHSRARERGRRVPRAIPAVHSRPPSPAAPSHPIAQALSVGVRLSAGAAVRYATLRCAALQASRMVAPQCDRITPLGSHDAPKTAISAAAAAGRSCTSMRTFAM